MSVNSKALEDYLSRKDARLLYSYLEAHHRSREACSLALKLALTEGDPMDISERQHLLSLAASSAASSNDDRAVEIQDRLVVADFQKSILAVLSADLAAIQASGISLNDIQKKEVDELVNLVTSLRTRLKTISELYLQAAEPYKLYDIALQLLFAARADDQALVGRLWRSFIYRLVPDSAEGDTPKLFLQSKRDPQHIDIDQRYHRFCFIFTPFSSGR